MSVQKYLLIRELENALTLLCMFSIVTEGDLDRVWSSVENAIRLMGEDEDE